MPKAGAVPAHEVNRWSRASGVTIVGIDPGMSGGIAILGATSTEEKPSVYATAMPDTEQDAYEFIRTATSSVMFACVEQLTGFVGEAVPSHTMFKLGTNYGMLRGFLIASQIQHELVTPQAWQKALGIPKRDKKESKTQWKNRLKQFAQRLYPKEKITLATADAMLIMEYARRRYKELRG